MLEDALSVTVVVVGNGINDRISNQDKAAYISLCANGLGKGMNPSILDPVIKE